MKIQIYKSKNKFRYRIISGNHEKVNPSQAYTRKSTIYSTVFSVWLFFNGLSREAYRGYWHLYNSRWEEFKAKNIEDLTKKK